VWTVIENMLREGNCKSRVVVDARESAEYIAGHHRAGRRRATHWHGIVKRLGVKLEQLIQRRYPINFR